jgi:hypothetical protein
MRSLMLWVREERQLTVTITRVLWMLQAAVVIPNTYVRSRPVPVQQPAYNHKPRFLAQPTYLPRLQC